MRICLILPGFCADDNDWCIPVLTNFVREMAHRAEVVVFTPHYPYCSSSYEVHGATVHCLSDGKQSGLRRLLLWRRLCRAVAREHAARPFDLVHAFWATEIGFLGGSVARRLGVPFILSLAGGELASQPKENYGAQLRARERFFVRSSMTHAVAITAGSSWLGGRVPEVHRPKLTTIPLGVDADMFSPGMLRTRHRLLASASLIHVKDHPTLLRALALVSDLIPDVTLDVAGYQVPEVHDGLRRLSAELGVDEIVRWLGSVPHEQMPELYRSHDLLVHASLYEAQGMAILEALATGMPVISAGVGIAESIHEGLVMRFRSGDPYDLAEKIITSLESREHAQRAIDQGPILIRSRYSVEGAVDRFVRLYARILAERDGNAGARPATAARPYREKQLTLKG